jgi:electron transfer flavoprotein alpha subunit
MISSNFSRLSLLNRSRLLSSASSSSRSASTLIIAEPTPASSTSLAPATLSSITAAQKLHSGPITILNTNPSLDTSSLPSSVSCILNSEVNDNLAETISTLVQKAQSTKQFTHIVAPATKFGGNVLPRAAAMIDSSPITDVIDVLSDDTFIRPIYAGNALAKVQSTESVKVLSVRSTAFDQAECDTSGAAETEELEAQIQSMTSYVSSNESESDRPELSSASVVISGGRGMKDGDNFEMLYALADKMNGAVGASRAAVDAGFVPNDMQVGQTGKVVAPDLYIAVGISGAIQHLSGMKDSKTIVAINNDPEAPIFQVADYGLTQDLFKSVPELTEKV